MDPGCVEELRRVVTRVCTGGLPALVVPELQGLVRVLRVAVGQLESVSGGQLLVNPDRDPDTPGLPLLESVQSWWRDSALVSGQQAGADVRRAAILRELPVLGRAVTDGGLTPRQAEILCRLHDRIPEQDLRDSQEHLVTVAAGLNPTALADFVRHLIATHCEPALEAEQTSARQRRYLQVSREADDTVRGRFVLASEDAEVFLTVLEPLARRDGLTDLRSAGQRRADALVDVFAGAAAWMDLPDAGGQRPQLSYVMSDRWAAADAPIPLPERLTQSARHPSALVEHTASAAWTGPQTRSRIEALLCDARISRLLFDTRGKVVALHAMNDQITLAQRRAVSVRDRHCLAKGCTRPPAFCDVHHLTHRADGGPTVIENLGLLCRRHHVLWYRGQLALHDLHTPWLPDPEPAAHDPWDDHSPPLVV